MNILGFLTKLILAFVVVFTLESCSGARKEPLSPSEPGNPLIESWGNRQIVASKKSVAGNTPREGLGFIRVSSMRASNGLKR